MLELSNTGGFLYPEIGASVLSNIEQEPNDGKGCPSPTHPPLAFNSIVSFSSIVFKKACKYRPLLTNNFLKILNLMMDKDLHSTGNPNLPQGFDYTGMTSDSI